MGVWMNSGPLVAIVCGPAPGMLKAMTLASALALACATASTSDPGPLFRVLLTTRAAGSSVTGRQVDISLLLPLLSVAIAVIEVPTASGSMPLSVIEKV